MPWSCQFGQEHGAVSPDPARIPLWGRSYPEEPSCRGAGAGYPPEPAPDTDPAPSRGKARFGTGPHAIKCVKWYL